MSHHVSEPSTPTRSAPRIDLVSGNYTTPARARFSTVHLPPQELPEVISRFSSRRSSFSRSPGTQLRRQRGSGSRGSLLGSHHGSLPQSRSQSNMSSRPSTPNRRLSDHLSVRRRRRSSTGMFYDSGYVGEVTKDFLRSFSRALVREKLRAEDDPNVEVYYALDERHRLASISPAELPNEFDYSLPLPSDDGLDSPEPVPELPQSPQSPKEKKKPVFKSYLERILETRSKRISNSYRLTFERASSDDNSRQESVGGVINTSKFVIDNTLSGLPEFLGAEAASNLSMKLAEPVAFDNLQDVVSSNDSSEKESSVPPNEATRMRPRASSFELGNKTPVNYDELKFESINQLDVPSWESVPIFEDEQLEDDQQADSDNPPEHPGSDISQSGLVSGHFTIENEDFPQDVLDYDDVPENPEITPDVEGTEEPTSRPASPLPIGPIKRIMSSRPKQSGPSLLPNSLVKGCVSLVQHLPPLHNSSPPRKRKRTNRLPGTIIQLVTSKSNEFLQQLMSDLGAYATHRGSDQISMADAILYLKRTKAHNASANESSSFLKLSQSVFPLEHMIALDNSLQKATNNSYKGRASKSKDLFVPAQEDFKYTQDDLSASGLSSDDDYRE